MSNFNLKELEIIEKMPAKEAIMLMNGTKYKTGSDYSDNYLKKEIKKLEEEYKTDLCDEIENEKFKWSGKIFNHGRNVIEDKIWEETKNIN